MVVKPQALLTGKSYSLVRLQDVVMTAFTQPFGLRKGGADSAQRDDSGPIAGMPLERSISEREGARSCQQKQEQHTPDLCRLRCSVDMV